MPDTQTPVIDPWEEDAALKAEHEVLCNDILMGKYGRLNQTWVRLVGVPQLIKRLEGVFEETIGHTPQWCARRIFVEVLRALKDRPEPTRGFTPPVPRGTADEPSRS